MKTKLILLMIMASFFACQTNNDAPVPEVEPASIPRIDIELNAVEQQLTCQANSFAFNLLKTVYANENKRENILISPLSASLAFSMLNNGAAGATQEEIQQTLGYGNASCEAINTFSQKMVDAMQTLDSRGVFQSANSIWIHKDFPVINSFKQVNQQYFEAEIQNVDFSKQATITSINSWVNKKTNGKIPVILTNLNDDDRVLIMNALFFKGYWTEPFDKKLTADAKFRTSGGEVQMVPTMKSPFTLHNYYTKVGNCSAIELPFGNEAFSLVVVLPDEDTDVSDVVGQMNADWWEKITDFEKVAVEMFRENRAYVVKLEIPRFKMEYERTLNADLMALGMKTPFGLEADFSLISKEKLFISNVRQKTFAQMDEEGMEAAAVTIALMAGSSERTPEYVYIDFKVDRPFLFFIKEKSTRLVFFAGVMNKII